MPQTFKTYSSAIRYRRPPYHNKSFFPDSEDISKKNLANPNFKIKDKLTHEIDIALIRKHGFIQVRSQYKTRELNFFGAILNAFPISEIVQKVRRIGWSHREVFEGIITAFNGMTLTLQSKYGILTLNEDQYEFLTHPKKSLLKGSLVEVHFLSDRKKPDRKKTVIDILELEELSQEEVLATLRESGIEL
jgi:hypothetical protein